MTSSQDSHRGKLFLIFNWPITPPVCEDCTRWPVFSIVSQRMWASLKSSGRSLQWSWGRRGLEAEKKVPECTEEACKSAQKTAVLSEMPTKNDHNFVTSNGCSEGGHAGSVRVGDTKNRLKWKTVIRCGNPWKGKSHKEKKKLSSFDLSEIFCFSWTDIYLPVMFLLPNQ